MAGHPPTDQPAADTAKVMKAISPCQATLTTKIKEVKGGNLRRLDKTCTNSWTESEVRVSRVEDDALPSQSKTSLGCMQQQLHQLLQKQDDLENRLPTVTSSLLVYLSTQRVQIQVHHHTPSWQNSTTRTAIQSSASFYSTM